jgi:hypothetical protein
MKGFEFLKSASVGYSIATVRGWSNTRRVGLYVLVAAWDSIA